MKNILTNSFKNGLNSENIIYISFISVFMPFYVTLAIMIFISVYIWITDKAEGLFYKNGAPWIIAFTVYSVIVAIFNLNYIGIACSVGFVFLMEISLFVRRHITPYSFEKSLNICCFAGFVTSIFTFIDFFVVLLNPAYTGKYRATLYFFNCNYLATVFATVIIISIYKILIQNSKVYLYYISALFCAFGAYLTGSMFVWIEIFVGAATLLLLMRKNQMLSGLLLLISTTLIVIYFVPELLPRLHQSNVTTDNRIQIWKLTLKIISDSPVFGKGFLTYYNVYDNFKGSYPTTHSHNIFLEPVLCFGIIGTILIIICLVYYFKRVIVCRNAQSKYKASSLILALSFGLLAHSTTDLTFMWIQTGLLFVLILGSIGIEEKLLKLEEE